MVWSVVGQGNPQSPATPACTPSPSRETDTTKKKQAENAKPPRPQGCRGFCGNSSGAPGLWHKTPGGKGRPECKEEPQALYLRGSFPPAPRCTPVSPAAALDQRPPQASGHHRTVAIIGQCTSHQWLSQVSVHHTVAIAGQRLSWKAALARETQATPSGQGSQPPPPAAQTAATRSCAWRGIAPSQRSEHLPRHREQKGARLADWPAGQPAGRLAAHLADAFPLPIHPDRRDHAATHLSATQERRTSGRRHRDSVCDRVLAAAPARYSAPGRGAPTRRPGWGAALAVDSPARPPFIPPISPSLTERTRVRAALLLSHSGRCPTGPVRHQ